MRTHRAAGGQGAACELDVGLALRGTLGFARAFNGASAAYELQPASTSSDARMALSCPESPRVTPPHPIRARDEVSGMVTFASDDRDFVCAIALRIVRDPADAEDVAQEALLRAYRYRTSFRGDSRYRSWLYRIATTTALGLLRRRKRARLEPIERVDDVVGCCRARHLRRERRDPHVSRVETAAR